MEGHNIVGVQFRRAGKIYDFAARDFDLRIGDSVVVETDRGQALAEVVQIKFSLKHPTADGSDLKPILRMASDKDLSENNKLTPESALDYASKKIKELDLDMRPLQADVQFGGNKVIIYFNAPGRVDFRELVKMLATGLKSRVELKQVGARDETKLLGGLGICGREYCCSSFLREFVPVSIKMAKNQNLALNPTKVSGGCGRLLCCLTYEDETYSELRRILPPRGARVRLADGSLGDVIRGDLLNQTVMVETEHGEQLSVAASKVEVIERRSDTPDGSQAGGSEWGEDIDISKLMDET